MYFRDACGAPHLKLFVCYSLQQGQPTDVDLLPPVFLPVVRYASSLMIQEVATSICYSKDVKECTLVPDEGAHCEASNGSAFQQTESHLS